MYGEFSHSGAGRRAAALIVGAPLALGLALAAPEARAQLQLPGAFAPAPAGSVAAPPKAATRKPAHKPAPPKAPGDERLLGRALMLNGRAGLMEFSRADKELQISKLKLAGDQISRVGERCEVDVASGPIALEAAGKPAGVTRYAVRLPACAFHIDVLDGAVLAGRDGGACDFSAADCRVNPTGLWGEPASEITPKRAKEIEQQRRGTERAMLENYKAWIKTAGKDKALVRRIARQQAGFSSRREELCRSYAREPEHGYCALLATQAWDLSLAARVLPADEPEAEPPPKAKPARRR